MARTCTICVHRNRSKIDAALVDRVPFRTLAQRFGVSTGALVRHSDAHLPDAMAKAAQAAEASRGDDLLAQVRELQARAFAILTATEKSNREVALRAIREARECIRLLGELAGKLQAHASINIILSPEWRTVQALILTALQPHPEARLAVASALERLQEAPVAGNA